MSVDLEVLRRTPAAVEPPRRGARVAVGAVVVLGALAWAAFLLRDVWSPPRAVRTARVVVETGGAGRAATVFDATGWVEPDPFPIQVRPLVDGVVERFEVVEGDVVKAGETVLARLRNVDLEAEVEKLGRALARALARLPELDVDAAEAQRVLELKLLLRAEVARLEGAAQVAEAERRASLADFEVARSSRRGEDRASAQETLQLGGGGLRRSPARARRRRGVGGGRDLARRRRSRRRRPPQATRLERAVADDASRTRRARGPRRPRGRQQAGAREVGG
jgi:multidrug efflux pump subunit AcrA (membrane-fusion protein)